MRFVFLLVSKSSAILLLVLSVASSTFANSATWKMSPATGDWNHAANWMPSTIPDGPSDTATFASSSITNIYLSDGIEVNAIIFSAGASAFTVNVNPPSTQFQLFITGTGITNNSGTTENFVTGNDAGGAVGEIIFRNNATAGTETVFTNKGGVFPGATGAGGIIRFDDRSTADHAIFSNQPGAVIGTGGGSIFFGPGSTAGNATFTNQGAGANGAGAGEVRFLVGSNGGNATLINKGGTVSGAAGGVTVFDGGTEGVFTTSAANATLVARGGVNGGLGGVISFLGRTHTGGEARVKLFGNGTMLIDEHHPPGVTVGSIEGDGIIVLGANNLTVGGNKMSTTFSGVIKDGPNGPGGSLTKVGNKMLTLASANTYSGGTTIKHGALFIANTSGSATGPGPVLISNSALEGNGTIAGAVTVENGLIIPFDTEGSPVIRIRSSLTFNPISDYEWELDRSTGTAAQITCRGVTINENVTFSLIDPDSGILATGIVFTAINNTSASPIVGNFTNLPDGSTFTSKGNTFLVSYTGGDGNDLTLTVVP